MDDRLIPAISAMTRGGKRGLLMPPRLVSRDTRPASTAGFTLIELMVVMVIVAILFTYATLAIRGNSPEEAIYEESLRFERLVELALEEAILRGEEYAIEIFIDGYRFYRFEETGWTALSSDNLLRDRELPDEMELEVTLEETEIVIDPAASMKSGLTDDADSEELKESDQAPAEDAVGEDTTEGGIPADFSPQIYLLSSGEITPEFDLRFYILGTEQSWFVRGSFDGSLSTEESDL